MIADYLIARDGVPPRSGIMYDYLLAGDGVYVQGENDHLSARVPVVRASVLGLPRVGSTLALAHGRIPQCVWMEAVRSLYVRCLSPNDRQGDVEAMEAFVAIVWDGEAYRVVKPRQQATVSRVSFEQTPSTVLEIHSHHRMPAYFSPVDDADEQGLGLYGVVGRLQSPHPQVALRVGVYGYWMPVAWEAIFKVGRLPFHDVQFYDNPQEDSP